MTRNTYQFFISGILVLALSLNCYAATSFYTGEEIRIKSDIDLVNMDDILGIIKFGRQTVLPNLGTILENQIKDKAEEDSGILPAVEDINRQNNQGASDYKGVTPAPTYREVGISKDLVKGTTLKYQSGTGFPLDSQGKPDRGIRVYTGCPEDFGQQSRYGTAVMFPYDVLRVRVNNQKMIMTTNQAFLSKRNGYLHQGQDTSTYAGGVVGEDGSRPGNSNKPGKGGSVNLYAVADGIIDDTGYDADMGNYVKYTITVGGEKFQVTYMHMVDKVTVYGLYKKGDLKQGQLIGRMGSTGDSTGTHLHMEVKLHSNGRLITWNPNALYMPKAAFTVHPETGAGFSGKVPGEREFFTSCGFSLNIV